LIGFLIVDMANFLFRDCQKHRIQKPFLVAGSRQFYDGPNGGHIQWAFGAVSMMSID
jgi:hypothetical protein